MSHRAGLLEALEEWRSWDAAAAEFARRNPEPRTAPQTAILAELTARSNRAWGAFLSRLLQSRDRRGEAAGG